MPPEQRATRLREIWRAGVHAVARSLTDHPIPRPDLILADSRPPWFTARVTTPTSRCRQQLKSAENLSKDWRAAQSVLVAGTDGRDGPTTAAGGLVDGATWNAGAFLAAADSASYLARHAAHFTTGPTGTNVMDLALALRG